ncbi:MAG: hypothetical protein O2845_03940 [Proteobacteria bacterium]|nr:hypothetical protein [Pseudomonadota bacterium]
MRFRKRIPNHRSGAIIEHENGKLSVQGGDKEYTPCSRNLSFRAEDHSLSVEEGRHLRHLNVSEHSLNSGVEQTIEGVGSFIYENITYVVREIGLQIEARSLKLIIHPSSDFSEKEKTIDLSFWGADCSINIYIPDAIFNQLVSEIRVGRLRKLGFGVGLDAYKTDTEFDIFLRPDIGEYSSIHSSASGKVNGVGWSCVQSKTDFWLDVLAQRVSGLHSLVQGMKTLLVRMGLIIIALLIALLLFK